MRQDAQEHRADTVSGEDVLAHVAGWFRAVRARFHAHAELAVAEVRLAALGVAAMCFLATAAALLLVSAWGLAVAAAIMAMRQHGIALWVALAGFAIAHALAGALMTLRAISISKTLTFAAIREQLFGVRAGES